MEGKDAKHMKRHKAIKHDRHGKQQSKKARKQANKQKDKQARKQTKGGVCEGQM